MLPSFQDGGLEGGCGHSSPFRLHVQNRPQGHILCCPHPPGTPKASLLSIQKCNLPTFRSHFSTSGLHKSAETPGGLCQETGSKDLYLHRRHANPKFSEGGSYKRCVSNDLPVGESGVCCEYGQIYSTPLTGNGILRCVGQLHNREPFPPRQQSFKPPEGMQKSSKFQECFPVRSSTLNWKNGSSKGSCFPGSTPLQSTSTPEPRAKRSVLDKHARSLWEWCLARKITLRAEHIPGRLNVVADAESGAKPDAADWKLDSRVFKVLNHSFGPFTIDLFANRNNTQLERFYSYLPDPLVEQFDALVQPWREENAYAFPPFNLISKCLRKISLEGAALLIICPVWPAQA